MSPQEIIDSLKFWVIDLETTGGNHSKDRIIEIGMVKMEGCRVTEEKNFLINPEMIIPDFIQKLTGISQKKVAKSPLISDVINEVVEFIGDNIIVAHNTSFDVPFLNATLTNLGLDPLQNKVICTNVMTKHLMPEILNSNLNYMSKLFKLGLENAHRASDDALATAKLLAIYLNIFKDKGLKKVNQLYYPRNKFELDRAHFDRESDFKEMIEIIKRQKSSLLITAKGERGVILASIPIQNPSEEFPFVENILAQVDWKMITLRLVNPFIEALFQFCNHYLKHTDEIRSQILTYLKLRYPAPERTIQLDKLDFLVGHHLVQDQVVVYSFLNLRNNLQSIFKIPAQKKKLYQYLSSQINRFETNQKGLRKNGLHPDLVHLLEDYLTWCQDNHDLLYLNRKEIKKEKEHTLKTLEHFVHKFTNKSNFPTEHL